MIQLEIKDIIGWLFGALAVIAGILKWLFIQHDKDLTEKIATLQASTDKMREDIKEIQLEMVRSHSVFLNKAEFAVWRHEVKDLIDNYNNDQKETLKRLFALIEKLDDKKQDKEN